MKSSDEYATISDCVQQVKDLCQAKGWYDREVPIPESIALLHSEASEMLEEWRDGNDPTQDRIQEDGKPEGMPSELADLVIRCFDFAGRYGIDLEAAYERKMEYNWKRAYRHGRDPVERVI